MALSQNLDISYQTLYSELVQRSLDESFTSEFSSNGRFVAVEVKGKKYWYFDTPKPDATGQDRRYVGPVDDPEITKRVEAFKDLKADLKGRRRLVSTLTREAYLPRPLPIAGQRSIRVKQVTDDRTAGLQRRITADSPCDGDAGAGQRIDVAF